jgi:hypothetical protein
MADPQALLVATAAAQAVQTSACPRRSSTWPRRWCTWPPPEIQQRHHGARRGHGRRPGRQGGAVPPACATPTTRDRVVWSRQGLPLPARRPRGVVRSSMCRMIWSARTTTSPTDHGAERAVGERLPRLRRIVRAAAAEGSTVDDSGTGAGEESREIARSPTGRRRHRPAQRAARPEAGLLRARAAGPPVPEELYAGGDRLARRPAFGQGGTHVDRARRDQREVRTGKMRGGRRPGPPASAVTMVDTTGVGVAAARSAGPVSPPSTVPARVPAPWVVRGPRLHRRRRPGRLSSAARAVGSPAARSVWVRYRRRPSAPRVPDGRRPRGGSTAGRLGRRSVRSNGPASRPPALSPGRIVGFRDFRPAARRLRDAVRRPRPAWVHRWIRRSPPAAGSRFRQCLTPARDRCEPARPRVPARGRRNAARPRTPNIECRWRWTAQPRDAARHRTEGRSGSYSRESRARPRTWHGGGGVGSTDREFPPGLVWARTAAGRRSRVSCPARSPARARSGQKRRGP